MDFDVTILSPEKTILTYRLAGLGSRVLAHILDLTILVCGLFAFEFGVAYVLGPIDPALMTGVILFSVFAISVLYFILQEGLWNGQTMGKRAVGLRVRMGDGTPVTFGAALGRNLMRPADMLPGPYFVGLIAMFTNAKSQRIGDLIAGTIVCHERRAARAFAPAPHTAGIHPLESAVGELRGMTIEEYNALRRFADRFPELSAPVQNRLLEDVWRPVAERLQVPAVPNVHPIFLMEAVVMKYGRAHGLV